VETAARGHGIALARGRLVAGDLRTRRLVRLFEREVPAEYGYWAVWSGSSPKLPVIATVVDSVAALFNDEKRSSED
jgi:DNA-binding transcriptional LysR family regulator